MSDDDAFSVYYDDTTDAINNHMLEIQTCVEHIAGHDLTKLTNVSLPALVMNNEDAIRFFKWVLALRLGINASRVFIQGSEVMVLPGDTKETVVMFGLVRRHWDVLCERIEGCIESALTTPQACIVEEDFMLPFVAPCGQGFDAVMEKINAALNERYNGTVAVRVLRSKDKIRFWISVNPNAIARGMPLDTP